MSLAVHELRAYARAKRRYGCPSDPPGVSSDELEALCDLADAARRDHDKLHEHCRVCAALARLDGGDTG